MSHRRMIQWTAAAVIAVASGSAVAAHVTHKHMSARVRTPAAPLVATATPALAGKAHTPKLSTHATTHATSHTTAVKSHKLTVSHARKTAAARRLTHKPRTAAVHSHKAAVSAM